MCQFQSFLILGVIGQYWTVEGNIFYTSHLPSEDPCQFDNVTPSLILKISQQVKVESCDAQTSVCNASDFKFKTSKLFVISFKDVLESKEERPRHLENIYQSNFVNKQSVQQHIKVNDISPVYVLKTGKLYYWSMTMEVKSF